MEDKKIYEWKNCYGSILIPAEEFEKPHPSVVGLLEHKLKECRLSMRHPIDAYFRKERKYRRGKNRCLYCGCKLGTKFHKRFESRSQD